jgi:hypothetical protein
MFDQAAEREFDLVGPRLAQRLSLWNWQPALWRLAVPRTRRVNLYRFGSRKRSGSSTKNGGHRGEKMEIAARAPLANGSL